LEAQLQEKEKEKCKLKEQILKIYIAHDKILATLLQGETGKIISHPGLTESDPPPDRERHLVS